MPNLKVTNYVVLENGTSLGSLRMSKRVYQYTDQGMVLYPIGSLIPVIAKGDGCIGMAVIKSLLMEEDTTTVRFQFVKIGTQAASVLYSMYQNNASMRGYSSDDPYTNSDIVIPGAVAPVEKNLADEMYSDKNVSMNEIFNTIRGNRRTHNGSVGGYPDDDDM